MNVIKQRQLSNGDKFTPKTDFVYSASDSSKTNGVNILYNIDGTIKFDGLEESTLYDNVQYTSVGKGQFLTLRYARPSTITGAQLTLWNKVNGIYVNLKSFEAFDGLGWNSELINENKLFTFLGQCFKNQGDEDRYIIINLYDTDGTNFKWRVILWNIDKWEESARRLFDSEPHIDLTYDGTNIVYCIRQGNLSKLTITPTSIDWEDVLDNTGATVIAKRLYGITSTETYGTERLVYKDGSDILRIFNLDTSAKSGLLNSLSDKGTIAMVPAGIKTTFAESQAFIVSDGTGTFLKKRDGNAQIKLSSSTVERVLNVIYFKHTENVETEMWLAMVNVGNHNRFVRKFRVDWSAGYGDLGVVSNVLVGTAITAGTDIANENEIKHSCNTYNVGKFYDYGLQKKWDTN